MSFNHFRVLEVSNFKLILLRGDIKQSFFFFLLSVYRDFFPLVFFGYFSFRVCVYIRFHLGQ